MVKAMGYTEEQEPTSLVATDTTEGAAVGTVATAIVVMVVVVAQRIQWRVPRC